MSPAWLYYNGSKAGLTRFEIDNLPMGRVFDQIACWQIAECGAKERHRPTGSLMEQMTDIERRGCNGNRHRPADRH